MTFAGRLRGDNAALRPESPDGAREQVGASEPALDSELDELRRHVEELQAELERYRAQDHLLSKALLAATAYAVRIREEARREAEAALKKASAKARTRVAKAERERRQAEREILRLRKLADEVRGGLSTFLTTTLGHLQVEGRLDEEDVQAATEADAAAGSAPEGAPGGDGIEYAPGAAEQAADRDKNNP